MNSPGTESVRTFIAIDLPMDLKQEIASIQKRLRPLFEKARVSWVRPDNMHLTLRFIGDTPADAIRKLIRAGETITVMSALDLQMNSMGFFPNARKPRVFWCGYEDSEMLKAVQSEVERIVVQSGFPAEEKSFVPHITLARIKELSPKPGTPFYADMNAIEKEMRSIRLSFGHTAHEVQLIKSRLSPKGSEYTLLHAWKLKE